MTVVNKEEQQEEGIIWENNTQQHYTTTKKYDSTDRDEEHIYVPLYYYYHPKSLTQHIWVILSILFTENDVVQSLDYETIINNSYKLKARKAI